MFRSSLFNDSMFFFYIFQPGVLKLESQNLVVYYVNKTNTPIRLALSVLWLTKELSSPGQSN